MLSMQTLVQNGNGVVQTNRLVTYWQKTQGMQCCSSISFNWFWSLCYWFLSQKLIVFHGRACVVIWSANCPIRRPRKFGTETSRRDWLSPLNCCSNDALGNVTPSLSAAHPEQITSEVDQVFLGNKNKACVFFIILECIAWHKKRSVILIILVIRYMVALIYHVNKTSTYNGANTIRIPLLLCKFEISQFKNQSS